VLVEQARSAQKPLAVCVLATLAEEDFIRDTLNLPVFHFPGEAVRSLAYSRFLGTREKAEVLAEAPPLPEADEIAAILARHPQGGFLPMPEALALLTALGLAVPAWQTASDSRAAAAAAHRLGYPVVLKLAAPSLIHKTDAGGVLLNLADEAAVISGFGELSRIARDQVPAGETWEVVVMSQAPEGLEVLLGARRDRSFGPVVAFGAGGIATEVMDDVALRVAPINAPAAHRLIGETRIGRLLSGFRGQPAADLEALSLALATLSHFMVHWPRLQEVDLNPVRVFPGRPGLLALDVRIRVAAAD